MAVEIERRWLVLATAVPQAVRGLQPQRIRQGYLTALGDLPVVRVRVIDSQEQSRAIQTAKAARPDGLPGMEEVEFSIPLDKGHELMALARAQLEKSRYVLPAEDGLAWELDQFHGEVLDGLCIAELELPSLEHPVQVPDWFGPEVTGQHGLSNLALAYTPRQARKLADDLMAAHLQKQAAG